MPRILVVEDDVEVRAVVCEFLRDKGHKVVAASSAQQARELLAGTTIDLVIADCVMSGEQGGSLAQHAAALGVPAILTSGDLSRQQSTETAFPFLAKPFHLRELEDLVVRVLATPRRC